MPFTYKLAVYAVFRGTFPPGTCINHPALDVDAIVLIEATPCHDVVVSLVSVLPPVLVNPVKSVSTLD